MLWSIYVYLGDVETIFILEIPASRSSPPPSPAPPNVLSFRKHR